MNLSVRHDPVEHYLQRIKALETELDEMTVALSQAWDQLVPFLQDSPEQTAAGTVSDLTPIIHAVMAGADAEFGVIYLFDGEWSSVPETLTLSAARKRYLRDTLQEGSTLQWEENPPDEALRIHWVFAPIIADHQIIGSIGVGTAQEARSFTAADLRIVARMAERVSSQIVAAQLALSRQREALAEREMQIASMIQRSIQPCTPPELPNMQLASYWQPARSVGGDAWGWVPMADGRIAWFVLDVAGKGLPAALAAMSLHTALRMGLRMGVSFTELLSLVNEQFYDTFTDTDLMATVTLLAIDPQTGVLEQANAGHLPTLIRQGSQWVHLGATAPPIGVLETLTVEKQVISLSRDDLVLTYSDGFTEIETAHGLWGDHGLTGAVPLTENQPAAAVQRIIEAAEQVAVTSENHDDRTLIIATLNE